MRSTQRITSDFVAKLPFASDSAKPKFYWDAALKGFAVKVTAFDKVYIAEAKVAGKTCRATIDAYQVISAEDAKRRAKVLLGQMHEGINPNKEKKAARHRGMTFEAICNDYLQHRDLKERTKKDYIYHRDKTFKDWLPKPFLSISRTDAEQLFHQCAAISPAQANQAFRFARAVFKFSKKYRGEEGRAQLSENPIDVISEGRLWKRVPKRANYVKDTQLKPLWEALWEIKNERLSQERETVRDFLLLLLFSGLRHTEALTMRWENVDFEGQTFTIPDPKNSEPHTLPMSDYLYAFFQRRKELAGDSPWVFPSHRKEGTKHISVINRVLDTVVSASGVKFTPHDLRRTFLTVAKQVPGRYNIFFIKRLANHKVADITSDYVQINEAEFRKCMQEITDYILDKAGAKVSRIGMPVYQPPPPSVKRQVRIRTSEHVKAMIG
jgi:integrase